MSNVTYANFNQASSASAEPASDYHRRLIILLKQSVQDTGRLDYQPYVNWMKKNKIRHPLILFHKGINILEALHDVSPDRRDIHNALGLIEKGKGECEKVVANLSQTLKQRRSVKETLQEAIESLDYVIEMISHLLASDEETRQRRMPGYLDELRELSMTVTQKLEQVI